MQLLLPIFPKGTKLITPVLGVFEKEDFVFYLLSGQPIHQHAKDDIESFRYVAAKLVVQGLCKQTDIVQCFGVSSDSIYKSVKRLREKGEKRFFEQSRTGGKCYKLTAPLMERIQSSLDAGESNYAIAKREGISEGAIRYGLKQERFKKKQLKNP